MTQPKYGYMCKTDWNYELSEANDGTVIYPSLKVAHSKNLCIRMCGAVKVRIELEETIDDSEIHKLTGQLPEIRDSFDI